MNSEFWLGKRVFITGLPVLKAAGCRFVSQNLEPKSLVIQLLRSKPNLFTVAHVPDCLINSTIADNVTLIP